MASSITNLKTYQQADELMAIFRSAVKEAQSESRRQGVPNVYYFDGKRYFELPTGELIHTSAEETRPLETADEVV